MSSATTLGGSPAARRPGTRPRVRHGFLAAALLVVAVLRAAEGDWPWALVLGAGAAAEAAVLLVERRSRRGSGGGAAAGTQPAGDLPDRATVSRSLRGHQQAGRLWAGVLAVALVAAVAVVGPAPSMGLVVAAVALVALVRVRRERRTVAALRVLADAADPSSERGS